MEEKKYSMWQVWNDTIRSWKLYWNFRPQIFIIITLHSLVTAILPYSTIWLSAQFINELSGNRNVEELGKWVVFIIIVSSILELLKAIFQHKQNVEYDKLYDLDEKIYMDKMISMDYTDIESSYAQDLLSNIQQTRNYSGWGTYHTISYYRELITAFFQIIGGISLSITLFLLPVPKTSPLTFLNSPFCIFIIIGVMLLIAILSPIFTTKANEYFLKGTEAVLLGNRIADFYCDLPRNRKKAEEIRIYEQDKIISDYVKNMLGISITSICARYAKGPMGLWKALSESISMVFTGVIYLYVCLKAWGGAFGVGSVTQYVGAITNLFIGFSGMLRTLGRMRINEHTLEKCFEFLDIPNKMYQGSLTTEKRMDRKYEIEFKDVSFKYPGSDTYVLRHVNVKFQVGRRLAIVGMNGSGKTTFIKLLCRLYDPDEGQILLNGIDIRKYRYDDYMDIFSIVFQDFQLFALPLGQNIATSLNYDESKVEKALNDAGFDDRLKKMSKMLDTYLYKDLDKEGVDISGGEAQKIAIARALYKDAPFLILDEPTAALDPIAESEIYANLNKIVGDKTAIYISHRLSSCKFCDEIMVFNEGAIIQKGTHDELLKDTNGKYYELWYAQAQYYEKKSASSAFKPI